LLGAIQIILDTIIIIILTDIISELSFLILKNLLLTPEDKSSTKSKRSHKDKPAAPVFTDSNIQALYTLLSTQIAEVSSTSSAFGGRVVALEGTVEVLEDRLDRTYGSLDSMMWQSVNQADITDSLINDKNHNQVIVSGLSVSACTKEDGTAKELS
jgi:hypothetical protein